ncbi:hypothetical protein MYRNA_222 [Mycobacterium phage Myrna]|uniref:TPM domain-containing protein n=1 Tax=Mycobacterium phage Myrna TaxID=546805 RepID=B5LJJ2_9CAUD|nr:membrane protein [Mycobacterium phage Myrna]ACH62189.1 hypothetical protein MYRNA_222 [Mycobacterium phage Myrna]
MNPLKALRLVAILLGVFVLAFACSDGYYRAQADPDTDRRVVVEPSVDDARSIENRIESRLRPDDEIYVTIWPAGEFQRPESNGVVFLYAEGKQVTVVGNDWVPQVWLDERLDRIDNVTRRPVDQIVRLIDEIHEYQEDNPRESPAPEITIQITTAEAPPPPPAAPEPPKEPFRWTTAWKFGAGAGGGVALLFIIWLPLHIRLMRRRKRLAVIAKRAEEQADWTYDKYGIKSTID